MRHTIYATWLLLALFFISCRATEPLIDSGVISYDPPGRTTETQPLDPHHKRTIGVQSTGVWVSNEFDGARMSDFWQIYENLYHVEIRPENAPINWSSWYAFNAWSNQPQTVIFQLGYQNGRHRYKPVFSRDAQTWSDFDDTAIVRDTISGTARITIDLTGEPVWIAAQELYTTMHVYRWLDTLQTLDFVERSIVGFSHLGRSVERIVINETGNPDAPMVIVMGRQHPPEVPGAMAQHEFINTLVANTPEALAFRQRFQVVAYPLINPDGVDGGHWRHNAGGVDLNRDWSDFNQPETRAVAQDLLQFAERGVQAVYGLDFHSTVYDVFYTINKDIPTNIPGLTDRWLTGINQILPDYVIREEPFGVAAPVSKNWKYHTFNIGAVTYEVGDETPRPLIRQVARAAALSLMRELNTLEQ